MTTALKRDALYAYAQRLMDVGIEVTAQAHVEIGAKWAREPRVIALALLCRTLGNMKGAVSLLRQRLLVEAQMLTRCCTENLICIGALSQTGDAFVDELLRADAASKKKQAGMVIATYAESEEQAETVIRLGEVVKAIEAKHPKAKPLNTKELSKEESSWIELRDVFSALGAGGARLREVARTASRTGLGRWQSVPSGRHCSRPYGRATSQTAAGIARHRSWCHRWRKRDSRRHWARPRTPRAHE